MHVLTRGSTTPFSILYSTNKKYAFNNLDFYIRKLNKSVKQAEFLCQKN